MTALLRKFGLFYLTTTGTFFFLSAYSLAADAPNYPFLPGLFLPIYLSAAMAMSERERDDPLLDMLPVTRGEIMSVKFGLAFVFIAFAWVHMALFTMLQGLAPDLTALVMKHNTLCCVFTLQLAAIYQLGLHFFGWSSFHKVLIAFTVVSGVFGIVFFIGLAESGRDHPDLFPLVPLLEKLPALVVGLAVVLGAALFGYVLRRGPWNPRRVTAG